jgi:SAM-dependent methyltransferase
MQAPIEEMRRLSGSVAPRSIVERCEQFLREHGDTYAGVGWTKSQEQTDRRYRVMLDVMGPEPEPETVLLDFGCGAAHLYEYITRNGGLDVQYVGADASPVFLGLCRSKFPRLRFVESDGLSGTLPAADFIVMNGVLTIRVDLPFEYMWEYATRLLRNVFATARRGVAFNVMSKNVEWERDDLFHVPMDRLTGWLTSELSRHIVIRHDYGLFEYTVYVFKEPRGMATTH